MMGSRPVLITAYTRPPPGSTAVFGNSRRAARPLDRESATTPTVPLRTPSQPSFARQPHREAAGSWPLRRYRGSERWWLHWLRRPPEAVIWSARPSSGGPVTYRTLKIARSGRHGLSDFSEYEDVRAATKTLGLDRRTRALRLRSRTRQLVPRAFPARSAESPHHGHDRVSTLTRCIRAVGGVSRHRGHPRSESEAGSCAAPAHAVRLAAREGRRGPRHQSGASRRVHDRCRSSIRSCHSCRPVRSVAMIDKQSPGA
jgi:hypothetical protein